MSVGLQQEFLCPHCGGLNSFITKESNCLREEAVSCSHCNQMLNVTTAAGIDNTINLVVSECESEEDAAVR